METILKRCFKCERLLSISSFYKHKQMADGRLNKCKDCAKSDVRSNYKGNREYYREYEKQRAMLPERVEARKKYRKTDAGKKAMLKANKKYRENNPNKYRAHNMVNNAVRDGNLFPEPCEICGMGLARGHHDDYAKPLNVRWLCPEHHKQWHDENGEGKNP